VARKQKTTDEAFRDALQLVAPGTPVREGLSAILQSGTGALLCFGSEKRLSELSEGGVKLGADFTPQMLYELCKMDGAIILNEEGTRIYYANRFLKPNAKIHSEETGTRHRTAQRMAAQAKCLVIAVSQRRDSVTLYIHERRHLLEPISTLVNKAMQAIQTLEKYLHVLQEAMQELTTREFQDVVTIFDVCKAIQRSEMVARIAQEIEPIILELGTEGRLLAMQVKEQLLALQEARLVVKDYYIRKDNVTSEQVEQRIRDISQQDLLSLGTISQALGYGSKLRSIDTYLSPRGYRVLTSTHRLSNQIIDHLVERFGSLQAILMAPKDDLVEVEGIGEVLAERIRVSLNLLRNQLALDNRV